MVLDDRLENGSAPRSRAHCPMTILWAMPPIAPSVGRALIRSIMETTLRDLQYTGDDSVDQAMLAGDPSRPKPSQIALQRLRFAQSCKRTALNIVDQRIDLVAYASIGARPVEIILPGARRPNQLHRISLCARPRPAFRSRTALVSRAAFFGLESRLSVST